MPAKGGTHTVWAKDRISRQLSGRKLSEEHKRNLSKAKMGHKVSAATRKKMSITRTGMKLSKQHRENISKSKIKQFKRKRWAKRLNGLNPFRASQ